ncbi:hypothetical protein ACKLNO_11220 [Neisseriaceae bacterium B1]
MDTNPSLILVFRLPEKYSQTKVNQVQGDEPQIVHVVQQSETTL